MDSQHVVAEQIVSALCTVPERVMRTYLLVEKLCALEAETVARVLQEIITASADRKGDYCLALEALNVPLLARRAGNAFMSDVYICAQQSGFEELVRILSRPEPSKVHSDDQPAIADEIPPGMRVSMAKSGNRQQIAHMLSDTHPLVIRALLKNPAMTEADVLKLTARRPAAADVQREVFHSRKWAARYAVKKALIFNPYTPTDIGMKIIHMLMVQDVRRVAESPSLHPWLRETARQYVRNDRTAIVEHDIREMPET